MGAMVDLALYYVFGNSSNLLFTLITFVIYVIFRGVDFLVLHNNTKIELAEKEKLLMNARITMMFSQIRSHFIFNILNAISGMCKYNPQKADETIIHFARYLRTNVETISNDQLIPFQASLRQLIDYVTLEQIRFEDKIRLETDIAVEDFLIPPLILQPIVENAIRHGITPKDSGGTITLKTFVSDGNICVVIADDGVGFQPEALEKETSVALKNVRFRLQHMIGGTMQIESRVGKGTTVTITLPWKEELA
jgi:LytS/YehU family sensor histidine kinase